MQKSINALPTGFKLNAYEIVDELGSGGFGITYKAYDSQLQTHVAIKEYLPVSFAVRKSDTIHVAPRSNAVAGDYQYGLDMFLQEARTLARFRHERIIRVIRFMEANNTAYLVMEYELGASLAAKIQDNSYPRTQSQILSLLLQLLQGLAVVHQASILHRDIKPSNIYIRHDNSPVLLDFGAARFALSEQTMSLTSIVSPGYAPFEQYSSDGKQGPWTDFYGLGATLYWVVTGNRPVEATARIIAVAGNNPDPNIGASQVSHGKYSPALLTCIDWMLEPKVEKRPRSADSILERIQALSNPNPTIRQDCAPSSETAARKPIGINKMLPGILGFGVLASAIAFTILLFNGKSEPAKMPERVSASAGSHEDSELKAASEIISQLPDDLDETSPAYEYSRQLRIDDLLKAANLALAENRLSAPADDSAVYYYRKILELSPRNPQAEAGLRRVAQAYIARAEQEWRYGNNLASRQYLDRAASVDPGNPAILAAGRRLAASTPVTNSAESSQISEPGASPELNKPVSETLADSENMLSEPLEKRSSETANTWQDPIEDLLESGDRALATNRLTTPVNDSAVYYYRKVLELSPHNSRAEAGLEQVVKTYITLAEQRSRRGDNPAARKFLDRALALDPGNPEILAAGNRLATAGADSAPNSRPTRARSAPVAAYVNVRAVKLGYRNGEISKAQFAQIRDKLTYSYKHRILDLKQLYREGKLSRIEYKKRVRQAKIDYNG